MNRTILLVSVQRDLDVIGVKLLHYHLLSRSYDSRLLFLPAYAADPAPEDDERICEFVAGLSPLFVGVSLMSVEYRRAARLTRVLKARFPSLPVLWGGIHPTISPETCLDVADYVCVGEGEQSILDFAEALSSGGDPRRVRNVCCRRAGEVKRNDLYPPIEDLDALPPYEHLPRHGHILAGKAVVPLDVKRFRKHARYAGTTYSVITSRGCPFSCTYCCNNAVSRIYGSRRVRFRGLAHVVDEVKEAFARNPYLETVNFQDDCFLARSPERLAEFCEAYRKEVGKPFIVRSIPTFITREKIASLKAAGLSWISMGLQSGSDRVCSVVYKRTSTPAEFLAAARLVGDARVAAFYDVILDNPYETDRERVETARVLAATPRPFYVQIFSLTMYPGTELYERSVADGLIRGDEYQTKDYFAFRRLAINDLIAMAPFLNASLLKFFTRLYLRSPRSWLLRLGVIAARIAVGALLQPVAYLGVVKMSQGGSWLRTLRALPNYVKEAAMRFGIQVLGRRRGDREGR